MVEENNSDNSKRTSEHEEKIRGLFENAMIALEATETKKQEIIRQLARDLESYGMLVETICEEITKVLTSKGYASEQYIRRCLEDKYKNKSKQKKKNLTDESEPISAELLQETEDRKEISITTDGKPDIEPPKTALPEDFTDKSGHYGQNYKEMLERSKSNLDFEQAMKNIEVMKQGVAELEIVKGELESAKLENGKLKETNESLATQLKEMSVAMNNFMTNKKENTKVEDSVEYQTIKSQLLIVTEERDELKQLESLRIKQHPNETFQSAADIPGITTITAIIPNEIQFPAKDLSTFFLDSKNAKQVMYLTIDANSKVVNWESDYKREKKS